MARAYSKGRKDTDEEKLIKLMERYFIAVGKGEHETAGFDRKAAFRGKLYLVEIKTESKLNSYKIKNGKRIPLTQEQAAIELLTNNEKDMHDWCKTHRVPYVIIYNEESILNEFDIKTKK